MTESPTDDAIPTYGQAPSTPPDRPGGPRSAAEADLAPVARTSPLDALRAELAQEVPEELLTLDVPTRADTAVRFDTEVEWEELVAWRKRASSKANRSAANPEGVDLMRLAAIVVANTAVAIVHKGTEVTGTNGEVLTFAHPELLAMLGVERAVDAVRKFYGRDGHVQAAAGRVIDAAGYGDELGELDPDEDPTTPAR